MHPSTRAIREFTLRLPDDWHLVPAFDVPAFDQQVAAWGREMARALVSGAPVTGVQAQDAAEVLAEQLVQVAEVVRDTAIVGLASAVLVRRPETGTVDAMLTAVAQEALGAEEFTAQLTAGAESSEGSENTVYAGQVSGDVEAGAVEGLHLILGHGAPDAGEDVGLLEERVVLGVFPAETRDMIEITAIARGVGSFEDMPQEMIDLLVGLSIDLEVD